MSSEQDQKEELFAAMDAVRADIKELKAQTTKLHEKKEQFYSKKREVGTQIASHIRDLKEKRSQRDELTKQVKDLKSERDKLSKEVKDKIEVAKKSAPADKEQTFDRRESPGYLKHRIEQLETQLETDVMKFEREKRIRKEVTQLKKKLEKVAVTSKGHAHAGEIKKDIRKTKQSSDKLHKEVKSKATASQDLHEDILKASKTIDALKAQEKEHADKFADYKAQYTEKNTALKEKIAAFNDLAKQVKQYKLADEEKSKAQEMEVLKEKSAEVEEKIKSRKKLSTEDLLVFQGHANKK